MKNIFTIALLFIAQFTIAQQITTFPYFTGFEGAEGTINENFPEGWTVEDLNTGTFGNQGWTIIKNTIIAENAHTDSTAIHMYCHPSEVNNDWIYTPSIQMEANKTYKIKFWYKVILIGNTSEKLKIHVATSNSSTAMLATNPIWDDPAIVEDSYVETEATFTPTASDIYYFGFHYYSDPFQFILYVDDVTISEEETNSIATNEGYAVCQLLNNPTSRTIKVDIKERLNSTLDISLHNLNGASVYKQTAKIDTDRLSIPVTHLTPGVYVLNIVSDDRQVLLNEKVIVIR